MNSINSEEILGRIRNLFGVRYNKDLSAIFNYSATGISGWVTRNTVPLDVLISVSKEKNVSLDWLIYGKKTTKELSTYENIALMVFNALDDEKKLEILGLMLNGGNIQQQKHTSSISVNSGNGNYVGGNVKIGTIEENDDTDTILPPSIKNLLEQTNKIKALSPISPSLEKQLQILDNIVPPSVWKILEQTPQIVSVSSVDAIVNLLERVKKEKNDLSVSAEANKLIAQAQQVGNILKKATSEEIQLDVKHLLNKKVRKSIKKGVGYTYFFIQLTNTASEFLRNLGVEDISLQSLFEWLKTLV